MSPLRRTVLLVFAIPAALALAPPCAHAAVAPVGTQAGHPTKAGVSAKPQAESTFCKIAGPLIEGIVPDIERLAGDGEQSVCEKDGEAIGNAVGEVGNSVLDGVAKWIIGAATQVTTFIAKAIQESSTPQLQSRWFGAQFAPMADLGAALALLVALVALASAAVRRDPKALAATIAGIARAGIGTGMVVALTVIGLEVADQISAAVLASSPHAFWETVAHAWGTKGWAGLGSSALAALLALLETVAAIVVWVELLVRSAAIYIAVLFFPVVLAASIWPALSAWTGRLARLLLLLVILKPVALIVLSLAGNAAAGGLSFSSGIATSVGTILTAIVILALAAFAPWALMYLLAADAESGYAAAGLRSAAGGAVAGGATRLGGIGRRAGGSGGSAGSGSAAGGGGPAPGGSPPPAVLPPAVALPAVGPDPAAAVAVALPSPSSAPAGGSEWAPPVAAEAVGAGSVGAAAGVAARTSGTRADVQATRTDLSPTAGGATRAAQTRNPPRMAPPALLPRSAPRPRRPTAPQSRHARTR